jgi:hypothetical protein
MEGVKQQLLFTPSQRVVASFDMPRWGSESGFDVFENPRWYFKVTGMSK